jgi:hypothetical protein
VSPVKYELGFYIPEDDILHSSRRENLKSYRHNLVSALIALPTRERKQIQFPKRCFLLFTVQDYGQNPEIQ